MSKMDEQIVVVPRAALFGHSDEGAFHGVLTAPEKVRMTMERMAGATRIMRRGDAEENEQFKQPIPYCVVLQASPDGVKVFVYERLKGGGEHRLHSKLSCGVGGHMGATFSAETREEVFLREAMREIQEELVISPALENLSADTIGLINDDSDPVGRVHVGVLLAVTVPVTARVAVRETEQLDGRWMNAQELAQSADFERLENWSQMALQAVLESRSAR